MSGIRRYITRSFGETEIRFLCFGEESNVKSKYYYRLLILWGNILFMKGKNNDLFASDRISEIKRKQLCWNCLEPHRVNKCSSNKHRKIRDKSNQTLIHKFDLNKIRKASSDFSVGTSEYSATDYRYINQENTRRDKERL